jgi:putative phage-type endonuclease
MTQTEAQVIDRQAWLEERKRGIGASEAAAALGLSPFESPRELYLRKLGILPEVEETEAMRLGTLLEPVIAQEYMRRTGTVLAERQLFLRSDSSPLMATLDAVTSDWMPVEFKAVGAWSARGLGGEETDEVPEHWLIQAHQQMLLAHAWRMEFAVLVAGQRLRIFRVERDEDLCQAIVGGVQAFWNRVLTRVAPPSDARADGRILHLLYPGSEGEVELGDDEAELVDLYEEMDQDLKWVEVRRKEIRARLLEKLGNHAVGRLPDGRSLTRRHVEIGAKTISRKAYSYVSLRVNSQKGDGS